MVSSLILFVLVLMPFLFLYSYFGEVWEKAEIKACVQFAIFNQKSPVPVIIPPAAV